ncbi:biotin/lipoyl-binding protein, partial [Pseudoalteromonas tetraodonis]
GGFFEKGDVLLQLDDRDLKAEVKSAQANLLNAEQNLLEEQARGRQALTDWQRLGNESEPSILVLRKPQLAAAQAQVLSA